MTMLVLVFRLMLVVHVKTAHLVIKRLLQAIQHPVLIDTFIDV
jgi:hypothetical protein